MQPWVEFVLSDGLLRDKRARLVLVAGADVDAEPCAGL